MSLIMGQIEPEHQELLALEYGKIAESDFVYSLSSTNIDQSAPNLVEMYVTIRSRMSSIKPLSQWRTIKSDKIFMRPINFGLDRKLLSK